MSTTKFMILSDTHNLELDSLKDSCGKKVDVLLHCGDLTQVGGISAYKKALRLLGSFDAELKLVISGNHDISLDGEYWRDGAKEMGVTYLTEGVHKFTLNSGTTFTLYATPYQPECGDWAFSYKRTEDRFKPTSNDLTSIATNLSTIPDGVDIMMTHGPPKGILDLIPSRNEHAGCEELLRAVKRVQPLLHCFGHIHEGYGIEGVNWDGGDISVIRLASTRTGVDETHVRQDCNVCRGSTLFVNAAIMDDFNQPAHRPWFIDLQL